MLQDKVYYFTGTLFPFALGIVLYVGGIDPLNIFLFTTSFLWTFALRLPQMRKRARERKYRFSLVRTLIVGGDFFQNRLAKTKIQHFSHWVLPLLVLGFLTLISESKEGLLFVLVGLFLAESIERLCLKRYN